MKLLAYIKIGLKNLFKQLPTVILSFAVLPITLALLMGYIQKDMFTPSINDPIISVIIVDEDNTPLSRELIRYLKSEDLSKVLEIKDEDAHYKLIIPKGYEEGLVSLNSKLASTKIIVGENASTTLGNVLANLIDNYNNEVSQGIVIKNNTDKMNLDEIEKENLISSVRDKIVKAYTTNAINNNIITVRKSLDSFEFFSISFLNFTFIMFIMGLITGDDMERKNCIYNRVMSTAMTKYDYFHYNLVSNYIFMIILNAFYVLAFRLSGLSFEGSIPLLIIIILMQSLMITVIASFLSNYFGKAAITAVNIFLIFQVFLGGMIIPLEKFPNSKIFTFFAKYRADVLISQVYKNYILYNDFSSIGKYLGIIAILSLFIYGLSILKIKLNWGEVK